MKHKKWYLYALLALTIWGLFNFPATIVQRIRSAFVGTFFSSAGSLARGSEDLLQKLESLKRENEQLCQQLEHIRDWLLQEDRLEEQIQRICSIDSFSSLESQREVFARRHKQMTHLLEKQTKGVLAQVIYREPSSWSSFIWINVGRANNKLLKEDIVNKNSPVVIGNTLIGVVEEVFEFRSKVRLVTDANLTIAVRVSRGARQQEVLTEKIQEIASMVQRRENIFSSKKEEVDFFLILQKMKETLKADKEDRYLAKGELYGASHPLWRSRGSFLQGVGFNYDFPDDEGPSRDLRTGEPLMGKKGQAMVLLQEEDLLVTSGLDGVFPPGLEVAIVSEVGFLREGECSYHIKAKWINDGFCELNSVFVLPPL